MVYLEIAAFLAGAILVTATLLSAVRTFVLPRSARSRLTALVFRETAALFRLRLRRATSYEEIDRTMALFAPIALLLLPISWIALVLVGYAGMFWGIGVSPLSEAFILSGSSLLTLGFARPETLFGILLSFSEATIGLGLVALLISYLPAMYSAFSRREAAVTMLEVRAGDPPSAVQMMVRAQRIHGMAQLPSLWETWESWFADLEESHTSLAAIVFFRSPRPGRSWITAAGAVLDSAALYSAAVDRPTEARAGLCIRAGYISLRAIAENFAIEYPSDPHFPDQPISVSRDEFDSAYDELAAAGLPLKPDREQAWLDFAGWRVNYDGVLIALAKLTMAPYAPWSSDRSPLTPIAISESGAAQGVVDQQSFARRPRKKK